MSGKNARIGAPMAALGGAIRYEFRMQIRRRSVWFVLGLLSALVVPLWLLFSSCDLHGCYQHQGENGPLIWFPAAPSNAVLQWAQFVAALLPVGVGLVLADRLARDRGLHVDELLNTAQGSLGARLFGKFIGCVLATLVPLAIFYFAAILYVLTQAPGLGVIPLAAAAFAAIIVPAIIFVAGFSIAIPVVMRVPVYQFLFIGYWFAANLMPPKIGLPSLIYTWLNATGGWAQEGLFHFQWLLPIPHATAVGAYASITLLVGLGAAAMCGAWGYIRWRQANS
jgi:ABC-2 type transport system permease protein